MAEHWRDLQRRVCDIFNSQPGFFAEENKQLVGARATVTVDVYVRHSYGPLAFAIVVECKAWKSAVPQEKAFALKAVVDDVGASMGILLTELGIQLGASSFIGEKTNLVALTLDELETLMPRSLARVAGVKELELLLRQDRVTERELVRLFELHPHFLSNLGYERIIAGPVLRTAERPLMPDFILKPTFSDFCDLLEVKNASTKLLLGQPDRQRVTRAVVEAVAQLRAYREYFEQRANVERFRMMYGVICYRPHLLLLAGRSPELLDDLFVMRNAEDQFQVRVVTFDQLLSAARARLVETFI